MNNERRVNEKINGELLLEAMCSVQMKDINFLPVKDLCFFFPRYLNSHPFASSFEIMTSPKNMLTDHV